MIDTALATLLRQVAGVGDRVQPSTETAAAANPRVMFTLIADPTRYTDNGKLGLRRAHYQLDVFADRMTEARAVVTKIAGRADHPDEAKRGLDCYRGEVDQTAVGPIFFPDQFFTPGTPLGGQNQASARCVLDLIVWYREL